MRLVLALFALFALPANAAPVYFTDFVYQYESAPFTEFECTAPEEGLCLPNNGGFTVGLELYLQYEGLVDEIPDGTYAPDDFYSTFTFNFIDYALTFASGDIVDWWLWNYAESGDGLSARTAGDAYRPFVDNYFYSTEPGSWTLLSTGQWCYDEADEDYSCSVPQVPLPAGGLLLMGAILLLPITAPKQ